MLSLLNNPFSFILWLTALIIAVTIHEFSHALAADKLGDPTPRLMGRLTLNPLAHLDPVGTLMLLLVRFGWGKPVQFDPFNLQNPRRDAALISLAGPVANFLLATVLALLIKLPFLPLFLPSVLTPVIILNVVLGVFNLIPIHPLDGFKVVAGLLPSERVEAWEHLSSYGIFLLIFLLLPIGPSGSLISLLIGFPIDIILNLLLR